MNMNCVLFVCSDRILLCSLSWSQTQDPPASASLELGYSGTMPLARNCFHLQKKKIHRNAECFLAEGQTVQVHRAEDGWGRGVAGGKLRGAGGRLARMLTRAFPLPGFAPLQVQAQDVIEGCQLYQGQGRDLLHVPRRQVSYPGHTQSALGDSEPLGKGGKTACREVVRGIWVGEAQSG